MMTFVFKQYLNTTRCKEITKNRKVFKIIPEDVLLLKMGLFHGNDGTGVDESKVGPKGRNSESANTEETRGPGSDVTHKGIKLARKMRKGSVNRRITKTQNIYIYRYRYLGVVPSSWRAQGGVAFYRANLLPYFGEFWKHVWQV